MNRTDLKGGCFFTGDNVEIMKSFPDGVIDLTVTSPPYDDLRTYTGESEWSWEKFTQVANELARITKPGGVIVWNVADATVKGSETGASFRQALYFKDACKLNLHDTMIWVKDGGGAVGSTLCYTQNHEYMFIFSKGKISNTNLIRDKLNLSFGKDKSGIGRRAVDGTLKIENRKPAKKLSKRNNWWQLNNPAAKTGHPATFPERMATDHIVSWSNAGDTVFDPFMGSGTTAISAIKTGRKWIGCEISEEYSRKAVERITSCK